MAKIDHYYSEDFDSMEAYTRRAKKSAVRMRMEDEDWTQSQSRKHRAKASKQHRKAVRQVKFQKTDLDLAA